MMNVQLRTVMVLEINGTNQTFQKGDWVQVGKQTALRWIAEGIAWSPKFKPADSLPADCAIAANAPYSLAKDYDLPVEVIGDLIVPSLIIAHRTLFLDVSVPFRQSLLIPGFRLLDTWEVAVPLCEYSILAAHIGSHAEREYTASIIRDLRVPVYDTRLMFVRRCAITEELLRHWTDQRHMGEDGRLAFLRALYLVKPLIHALPYSWTLAEGNVPE